MLASVTILNSAKRITMIGLFSRKTCDIIMTFFHALTCGSFLKLELYVCVCVCVCVCECVFICVCVCMCVCVFFFRKMKKWSNANLKLYLHSL